MMSGLSGLCYVSRPAQTSRREDGRTRPCDSPSDHASAEPGVTGMNRKSVIVGGVAAAVLIVGGITAVSSGKGSTATASVPAAAPAVPASTTAPPPTAVTTTVTRVIDGDTVETTDTAGTVLTIRII